MFPLCKLFVCIACSWRTSWRRAVMLTAPCRSWPSNSCPSTTPSASTSHRAPRDSPRDSYTDAGWVALFLKRLDAIVWKFPKWNILMELCVVENLVFNNAREPENRSNEKQNWTTFFVMLVLIKLVKLVMFKHNYEIQV